MYLHFFIKCGTTHNQPQQAGISKNEVEQTKNSLIKLKERKARKARKNMEAHKASKKVKTRTTSKNEGT